jgi:hypothetical protein
MTRRTELFRSGIVNNYLTAWIGVEANDVSMTFAAGRIVQAWRPVGWTVARRSGDLKAAGFEKLCGADIGTANNRTAALWDFYQSKPNQTLCDQHLSHAAMQKCRRKPPS